MKPAEIPEMNLMTIDNLKKRGPTVGDPFVVPQGESIIYAIRDGIAFASTHHARMDNLIPTLSEFRQLKASHKFCGAWTVKDQQQITRNGIQKTLTQ